MLRADLAEQQRNQGHDVVRVSARGLARADDAAILAQAVEEQHILVTLDEDFGDWAVLPLSEHLGVIRVKTYLATTDNIAKILRPLLRQRRQAGPRFVSKPIGTR